MSAVPIVAPTIDNITVQTFGWYPPDVDDGLLFLARDITAGVAILCSFLGTVTVVSSLKSLTELAQRFTDLGITTSRAKKKRTDSWIVHKLKSKYAAPTVICGNGAILLFIGILWLVLYADVGGKATCDAIQPVLAFLYVISLWSTYILFEIRRISTGTENFKRKKYYVMHGVRFATLCMPVVSVLAFFTTSGIHLADVQHCILVFNPTVAWVFGIADLVLSMGHITVFIFAIRQRFNFKLRFAISGTRNQVQPSTAASNVAQPLYAKRSLVLLNGGDLASPRDSAASKIQAISRRNLRLASITVTSTAFTMVILASATLSSPPAGSSESRSYYYLEHVSQGTCLADAIVNTVAVLVMTSSWQPAILKKCSSRLKAAAVMEEESEVSTLGGED